MFSHAQNTPIQLKIRLSSNRKNYFLRFSTIFNSQIVYYTHIYLKKIIKFFVTYTSRIQCKLKEKLPPHRTTQKSYIRQILKDLLLCQYQVIVSHLSCLAHMFTEFFQFYASEKLIDTQLTFYVYICPRSQKEDSFRGLTVFVDIQYNCSGLS